MRCAKRMAATDEPILVSSDRLQEYMPGCGKGTAVKIGIEAGARVKIGRRVLWNLPIIREYLNSISKG